MSDNMTVEQAKALLSKKQDGRLNEAALIQKYPHVVPGSLRWNLAANKQQVTIKCVDCGTERDVFTSDLFQITRCAACTKEARKAKRAQRKAAMASKIAQAEAILAATAQPVEAQPEA